MTNRISILPPSPFLAPCFSPPLTMEVAEFSWEPKEVDQRSYWFGPDKMKNPSEWNYTLTADDITELESAFNVLYPTGQLEPDGQDLSLVTSEQVFALIPNLAAKLVKIREEVVNGQGFYVLKGLPVWRYSMHQSATSYWLIGAIFGKAVSQNGKGHLLGHVTDLGFDPKNPLTRIYTTNAAQPYHTDSSDVVGLLCLRPAKSGGESSFVSSVTVYNQLLKEKPEVVKIFSEPVYHDRKGEVPEGKLPYFIIPIFNWYKGRLSTFFPTDFIHSSQRHPEVPRHTDLFKEGMRLMQEIPNRDEIRFDMILEPGDIQLLHNHQILHSRSTYEDFEENHLKRHLLRLWVSPPNGRPLPECFSERYGSVEPGKRGGINVPGVNPNVNIETKTVQFLFYFTSEKII